jgi:hypothetical protein
MPTNKFGSDRFIQAFDGLTGSHGNVMPVLWLKNDEKQLPGRIGNLRSKH